MMLNCSRAHPVAREWWAVFLALILSLSSTGAGEREATPAVVNPAIRSPLRPTLSLDGDWEFVTDPSAVGETQGWFQPANVWSDQLTLQVPGCWEAQGVGGIGPSVSYAPEKSLRTLRGTYRGTGWYRKSVTIPAGWAGKEIWLKIGGVHAQGWFWVNGTYVGSNACYCGTYKYKITDLIQPGTQAVIVAKVRNDVASLKGLFGHIERFGGLYRSVELDATPQTCIDDVYVTGDLDQQTAAVNVTLRRMPAQGNTTNEVQVIVSTLDGTSAGVAAASITLPDTDGLTTNLNLTVPLNPFRAWSPETPNLYRADVVLKANGQAVDGWVERFGVRKWEVRSGKFYFNNQKFFMRGFGDDFVYPLTLSSPASLDVHRSHLQVARNFGFNYVRHHTHCEVPEFYEAADEMGIMVQPELPYYGGVPSAGSTNHFHPHADLLELYTHYRRYVSLSTYCMGNEAAMRWPVDVELYQLAKTLDPSRLAIHQDRGGINRQNSDFHQGRFTILPWTPGTAGTGEWIYNGVGVTWDGWDWIWLPSDSWPFTAHEYLNLATEEDPRLASQYTGAVLPPLTPETFQAALTNTPLSWAWALATLNAGNKLQSIHQKRGLEQARLDPACDGYVYWTIIDLGSPAAQGLLDQFWAPKASTPDFFSQFNGSTAVLAKFSPTNRIFTSGDTMSVQWWVSPFGTNSLRNQYFSWKLQQGTLVLASGLIASMQAEIGEVTCIGSNALVLPLVTNAAKLKLIGAIPGLTVTNSWDVWVFPPWVTTAGSGQGMAASPKVYAALQNRYPGLALFTDPAAAGIDLVLVDGFDPLAAQAMVHGKKVLLMELPGPHPGVNLGWWTIGSQAGTAVARHPAFGDFPHEGSVDELFFRLVGGTILANTPVVRNVEPLMVGRGSAGYLLYAFQAASGNGKLLASGLNLLSSNPEAVYLLDQFVQYARSPAFAPAGVIDPLRPGFLGAPGNSAPLSSIAVFNATTKVLNNRGDQWKAVDRNLNTMSYLTPTNTTGAHIVAFELSKPTMVNRLRVAKRGENDGLAGIDIFNLSILYTTNTGPLNTRSYQLVSGLVNGYKGLEPIEADGVSPGGTVHRAHHDFETHDFYSLTFNPVVATAVAIQFDRAVGDPPYSHYGIYEAEVYPLCASTETGPIVSIFNATSRDLSANSDLTNIIDGDLETESALTSSANMAPQLVALDLDGLQYVDGLRVAKYGDCDLAGPTSGALGLGPIDNMNLTILYSTDTGPLVSRVYRPVPGLSSTGPEAIHSDNIDSATATITHDHHDFPSHGWYTLRCASVQATALAIRFERDAGDTEPWTQYRVAELQVMRTLAAALERDQAGKWTLTWPALPGKSYEVLASADLKTWTPLATGLISPTNELRYVVPDGQATGNSLFFRIQEQ